MLINGGQHVAHPTWNGGLLFVLCLLMVGNKKPSPLYLERRFIVYPMLINGGQQKTKPTLLGTAVYCLSPAY